MHPETADGVESESFGPNHRDSDDVRFACNSVVAPPLECPVCAQVGFVFTVKSCRLTTADYGRTPVEYRLE